MSTAYKGIGVFFACAVVAVIAGSAVGQDLSVDCSRKHQTIVGLGNCEMHWTAGDMYDNKDVLKMFVEDLGGSIIRFLVSPDVMPNEVADAKDISYKNFKVEGGLKKKLDFIAAVYAANPKEITVAPSIFTPPAWMKTNNSRKNGGNLKPDRIEHLAKYIVEWILYMKEVEKTPIHYFSIQNELSFPEPYDSCVYKPDMYAQTTLAVCDALKAANLDTKLFGPEEMTWNVNNIMKCVKPILSDPRGKERLTAVASHGYVDGIQAAGGAQEAAKLWQSLEPLGVQWWMSETSGEAAAMFGEGKDKKGKPNPGAFTMANSIHNALVYGNASAWIYLDISGHAKSVSDQAAKESLMNGDKPSKKYYASKQFYRYIRPGAVRVDAGPDGEEKVQISAFLHDKNKTLTIVMLNHDTKDASVTIDLKSAPAVKSFETYRTNESDDCKKLDDSGVAGGKVKVTLAPQSVTTLFGKVGDGAAASPPPAPAPAPSAASTADAKPADQTAAKPTQTAAPVGQPLTVAPVASPAADDTENQAKRRLASAKMYVESDPTRAKEMLRKIVEEFPNTQTAKDARRELSKIN